MSKRDMRAKKLLLAVLLAMSMQSYYAAPTWAAEAGQPSGQTETVDGKGQSGSTTTPATEEETSAPATVEEAAAEGEEGANTDTAVPHVTYGVRAASAGTDDYGIMPLADSSYITVDSSKNMTIGIGAIADGYLDKNNLVVGEDAKVVGDQASNNTVIGVGATAELPAGSTLGKVVNATVVGYKAIANAGSLAIGYLSDATGASTLDAINSVVIGTGSYTEKSNEVNFGYYKLKADGSADLGSTYYGRSLAGISSIDFIAAEDGTKGVIKNVSSINGVNIDDILAGGSVDLTNITTNVAVKASGAAGAATTFSIDNATGNVITAGSITAASGTIGGITLNGGALDKVTSINGMNIYYGTNDDPYVGNKGSMAFGQGAQIAAYTSTTSYNATAIGTGAIADGNNAVALGAYSTAYTDDDQTEGNAIAIGGYSQALTSNGIALGYQTYTGVNAHNSLALGGYASVYDSDTVSFGHKKGDKYDWTDDSKTYTDNLFRSLVNVKDLELNTADDGNGGAITGLTSINGVAVSGSAAAGLTIGGITFNNGEIMGKINTYEEMDQVKEASYTMKINGLDLYTGVSEYDKGSMAFGKDSAIGNITGANTFDAIAIGTGADAESNNAIALGAHSLAYTEDGQPEGNAMAIGAYAGAYSSNSVALGYQAYVSRFDSDHTTQLINNSMALGTNSSVNTSDTVSFGHKVGDKYGNYWDEKTYTDNLFRSLVNVKDLELNTADDGTGGAITGLTSINGVAVSGSAADGLTVSGVTLNGGAVNGVTLGLKGGDTDKDHVLVGGVDVTQMGSNIGGISRTGTGTDVSPYVTDVEGIKFSSDNVNFGGEWISTEEPHPDDPNYTVAKYTSNGKGALNGVTSINGMNFVYNYDNDRIIIGANVDVVGATSVTAIGSESIASGTNATLVGAYATASGETSTVLGYYASATKTEAIAIGSHTTSYGEYSVVIGDNAYGDAKNSVAIGSKSTVDGVDYENSTVVGAGAVSRAKNGIALGAESYVDHTNSVAVGTGSKTFADNEVNFGYYKFKADGKTLDTTTYYARSLAGISDITMTGAVNGVTLGTDGTVNGAAITSDSFNGVSIKSDGTVDGVDVSALKATVDGISTDGVGTADTAGIKRDTTGTATTKIEDNTSITTDGLTTNKVTVGNAILENGKLTVGAVTLTGGKLSGLTAGDITSAASTEAVTGGQVYTIKSDLETSISGKADTTTVTALDTRVGTAETNIGNLQTATADMATKTQVATDISTAKTELETAYNAADTALSDRATVLETATTGMTYAGGTTTFAGVVTAGEFKVGVTGFGLGSDGALTAKTVNGVTISGTDAAKDAAIGGYSLKTITDDIADLKTNGGATSANTVGIKHSGTVDTADSLTTIEGNTKISGSGIVVTGTVEATTLKEGGTELAAKYAGISEAYTAEKAALKADKTDVDTLKTTVGDADTGLAAVNTKVTDLQTATTGMSYDSGTTSTSFNGNVVVGNVGNQTHTQITDNAIIFGQGAEKQVTVDASGIHVGAKAMNGISTFADSNGTHIDHTSLVTGTVTAANLNVNGAAISGNATDGLSVGGVNIKDLQDRVTTIENSGTGGGTGSGTSTDTEGIKRTKDNGKDVTTIEGATSFTADGMQTANLTAVTAAIGGVDFAASGVMTNVGSINGISFADGKIGGVSLSGGKVNGAEINGANFNGVDVKALKNKVDSLGTGGGTGGGTGSGDGNTSGIGKPDGDTTTIEGNTTVTSDGIETNKVTASDQIIVANGKDNQTVISEDGIKVAEGKTNEVTINDKGIHVGKNSSVMNDTEGFITDKGLYIGVNSSNDISTAKFSVDKGNGTMTSKVGGYTFTNGSSGAVFSHSGDTAYGTGAKLDTTIEGNKVTTGQLNADELWVGGNQVTVSGGTVNQTDAIDNQLTATKDGYDYTNGFTTTQTEGTTQSASKESTDGKEKLETVNKTTAGGTSVTTSKTSTNSADRKTEQSSSFVTNESGMSLNTSTKVTDKDGNVTKNTSGETKMSGDSLTVSKTTVTSKDGKEETTTSSTTVGSGEVTLHREDGSTIRVGEAIEGMQGQIQDIGSKVNEMGVEIKEVGALSAALAGLHPQPQNANSRADFAMAMGSYEGKQALAVGGFYRPDKRTMLSIGASTTSSKHMMNMGISIALDKLPEAERKEQESNADLAERMKKLEADYEARLEKMEAAYEARMERLEARYARMKDAYEADKEQQKQQEVADETQENAEAASA